MTKCKICGDPIKKCPRRGTNNWCHTWHHEHAPKPKSNIPYIILIVSIIFILSFLVFNTSIKNDIEQSIQKYTQSNNETNLKTESEYYDCPSDPKSGSLSPEAYRMMGQIPPQCKKENLQSIQTPIATPIQTLNDNNRIAPPELSIIDKIKNILSSLGLPKSQPCIQTTSQNGGFTGTISQGDCNELQKKGFSLDEQKLIGSWNYKNSMVSFTFTFNDDRSGTLVHSDFGKSHFKYAILNNKLVFSDTDGFIMSFINNPSIKTDTKTGIMSYDECCNYKFINDKEIVIFGVTLEKSWW